MTDPIKALVAKWREELNEFSGVRSEYDPDLAYAQGLAACADELEALAVAGEDGAVACDWLRYGSLLYRLSDERRPQNTDEISITMAGGSRSADARDALAELLHNLLRDWHRIRTAEFAAPTQQAAGVPEGFVLVPRVATEAMRAVFRAEQGSGTFFTHTTLQCADFDSRYAAMLAAAPASGGAE